MDEAIIDTVAIGRLAKAMTFISGADHPTTLALQAASLSMSERDIKKARMMFLQLKPGERKAALAMISD